MRANRTHGVAPTNAARWRGTPQGFLSYMEQSVVWDKLG